MKFAVALLAIALCAGCVVDPDDTDSTVDGGECLADDGSYCRTIEDLRAKLYAAAHVSSLACELDEDCPPDSACVCGGCGSP